MTESLLLTNKYRPLVRHWFDKPALIYTIDQGGQGDDTFSHPPALGLGEGQDLNSIYFIGEFLLYKLTIFPTFFSQRNLFFLPKLPEYIVISAQCFLFLHLEQRKHIPTHPNFIWVKQIYNLNITDILLYSYRFDM